MKSHVDVECHEFEPTDELLKTNSSSVRKYNAEHQLQEVIILSDSLTFIIQSINFCIT